MSEVIRQVVAAVVVASVFGAVAAASDAAGSMPRVVVVERAPLVVAGRGFARHEQLRLVVRGSLRLSRSVRADAAGDFVARFPAVRASRCDALSMLVRRPGATAVHGFAKPPPECAQRATG